jgi:phospholipid-transporting ATPase
MAAVNANLRLSQWFYSDQQWYLFENEIGIGRARGFIEGLRSYLDTPYCSADCYLDMLTFIILYNNLIPISLIVTMEVVKFQQAMLINSDLDMYYAKTDTPALCRTSSLVEELGQIEYVFSDKTGTLTCNEMEFRCCSIAGVAYSEEVDESKKTDAEEGKEGWCSFKQLRAVLESDSAGGGPSSPFVDVSESGEGAKMKQTTVEFMRLLAVCHTVIPEVKNGKTVYQASSPDEAALVAGAELLGYQFHVGAFFCVLDGERCLRFGLYIDAQAEVCFRQHPRRLAAVRYLERARVQFDKKEDVNGRSHTRGEDHVVLQGRGYGHLRAA